MTVKTQVSVGKKRIGVIDKPTQEICDRLSDIARIMEQSGMDGFDLKVGDKFKFKGKKLK